MYRRGRRAAPPDRPAPGRFATGLKAGALAAVLVAWRAEAA